MIKTSVAKNFQLFRKKFKILGARRVTRSTFHTEVPKILAATVQNLAAPGHQLLGICVLLLRIRPYVRESTNTIP